MAIIAYKTALFNPGMYIGSRVQVESEIVARRTEDTCLEEEVTRYWSEILNESYIFDRPHKEVGSSIKIATQRLLMFASIITAHSIPLD